MIAIRPFAALLLPLLASSLRAGEIEEEKIEHAGSIFRVVRLEPHRLQLVWKNAKGEPYRTFDKVQDALNLEGKKVRFIMNAGIFEPGGIPSGLYIEYRNQKDFRPLNLADGKGNFFLKPNGVITYRNGSGGGLYLTTAESWHEMLPELEKRLQGFQVHQPISWGIQSGPMLLIDGKRHPAFTEGSASKLHRNGVGVDDQGRVVFAITAPEQVVNFWDFSGLFLKLNCRNALFLDGTISQMAVNPGEPVKSNPFGAMFVVAD